MSTIASTSCSTVLSLRNSVALVLAALVLGACQYLPNQIFPVPAAPPTLAPTLGAERIQILHTNDIHGRMEPERISTSNGSFERGGIANLAGFIAQQRARASERTLVLDAGDTWQGAFISNANKGAAMVQAMNLMGYDAQTLGNHDFDWGQDVLRARASEAHFAFLAANLVDAATGNVVPFAKPYLIKDLGVAKVGIIGIANPGTPAINKPANVKGLRFLAAAETVRRYLPEVRKLAGVIVVVTHMSQTGVDEDRQLARDVTGIDVIVSAHSHTALQNAVVENGTTIVQAGSYAEFLGHLDITIDPATHRVAAIGGANELITVVGGKVPVSAEVTKIVADRAEESKAVTARVVGRTSVDLPLVTRGESALGDLIVDAMLEYCRGQGWGSDVALYNGAGIRSAIPPGDVTFGKVYEVLPFDDLVVGIDLTGQQLTTIYGRSLSDRGANLVISGGTFTYQSSGTVATATVGGAAISPARTYHVCTIDYLALGGDGQSTFTSGKNLVYGDIAADAVADYLTKHSPVSPRVEGRIALP